MRLKFSWKMTALAALMVAAGTVKAQTVIWNGGDGLWFEPTNWDTTQVPGAGDNVLITNGKSEVTALGAQASSLSVSGSGFNGDLAVLGGTSLTVGGTTYLGNEEAEGIAYISGALNTTEFVVGNTGIGVLNMEPGGSVVVDGGSGTLHLGQNAGSKGYLNMYSGTITAAEIVGGAGVEQNITFFQEGNYTFNVDMKGNLSVFQNGAEGSVTTLAGSNSYTGSTTVVSGTLAIQSSSAIGSGDVVIHGGTFLVKAGVSISNAVKVAGGSFEREMQAGALDNAINVQSDLGGATSPTTAVLLDGELSENATLQAGFSATSLATNDEVRMSDVFSFSGVPSGDVFVLQLEIADLPANAILGWLNADNEWENAVLGNIGGTIVFVNGAYNPAEHNTVGTHGRNGNTVWAVLNHNSEFSVIPEPSSVVLFAAGLVLLARRKRI